MNDNSMFELDLDDGLSSLALKVHPYSIYDYDDIWRSTRQVLIYGAAVAVLLSMIYEMIKRYCFGVINSLGAVLIMRTMSSAIILLVLATVNVMYRSFQQGASCFADSPASA